MRWGRYGEDMCLPHTAEPEHRMTDHWLGAKDELHAGTSTSVPGLSRGGELRVVHAPSPIGWLSDPAGGRDLHGPYNGKPVDQRRSQ